MTGNNSLGSNGKLEKIPIKELVYNTKLPLDYLKLLAEQSATECEKLHIQPVVIARRNGVNYIINGQHTVDIVVAVTGTRDTAVWCKVFENIHFECEEEIFGSATEAILDEEAIE